MRWNVERGREQTRRRAENNDRVIRIRLRSPETSREVSFAVLSLASLNIAWLLTTCLVHIGICRSGTFWALLPLKNRRSFPFYILPGGFITTLTFPKVLLRINSEKFICSVFPYSSVVESNDAPSEINILFITWSYFIILFRQDVSWKSALHTLICLSLPDCNFICQVDEKDDAHIRFGTYGGKNEYSASSITVTTVLSIGNYRFASWNGAAAEWRQGGNSGDVGEAIVVRPRRGRRTKKKWADDEKRVI